MNCSRNDNKQGKGYMNGSSVIKVFKNHFLSAFGIQSKTIVEHIPIEVENFNKEKIIVEDLFRLEDGTLLHLEYKVSWSPNDLDRLAELDLLIYEKYEKPIRTIVVFGTRVHNAEIYRDYGAIKYKIEALWLCSCNGDEIAEELTGKVKEKGDLTDGELCRLVMLPVMKTEVTLLQRTTESVKIANHLIERERGKLAIKVMDAMAGRLLLDEDYDQVVQAWRKT